jgi:hypothetical protein
MCFPHGKYLVLKTTLYSFRLSQYTHLTMQTDDILFRTTCRLEFESAVHNFPSMSPQSSLGSMTSHIRSRSYTNTNSKHNTRILFCPRDIARPLSPSPPKTNELASEPIHHGIPLARDPHLLPLQTRHHNPQLPPETQRTFWRSLLRTRTGDERSRLKRRHLHHRPDRERPFLQRRRRRNLWVTEGHFVH